MDATLTVRTAVACTCFWEWSWGGVGRRRALPVGRPVAQASLSPSLRGTRRPRKVARTPRARAAWAAGRPAGQALPVVRGGCGRGLRPQWASLWRGSLRGTGTPSLHALPAVGTPGEKKKKKENDESAGTPYPLGAPPPTPAHTQQPSFHPPPPLLSSSGHALSHHHHPHHPSPPPAPTRLSFPPRPPGAAPPRSALTRPVPARGCCTCGSAPRAPLPPRPGGWHSRA